MMSDVPLPALSKHWPVSAASMMASIPLLSTVFANMSTSLPRGEATVLVVRLALTFRRNELILPSLLVAEAELVVDKLRPDLWEVLDSLAVGAWLMPLWGARPPSPGLPRPFSFLSSRAARWPAKDRLEAFRGSLSPGALWRLSAALRRRELRRARSFSRRSLRSLRPLRSCLPACSPEPPALGASESSAPSTTSRAPSPAVLPAAPVPAKARDMLAPGKLLDESEVNPGVFAVPAKAMFRLFGDMLAAPATARWALLPPGRLVAAPAMALLRCSGAPDLVIATLKAPAVLPAVTPAANPAAVPAATTAAAPAASPAPAASVVAPAADSLSSPVALVFGAAMSGMVLGLWES